MANTPTPITDPQSDSTYTIASHISVDNAGDGPVDRTDGRIGQRDITQAAIKGRLMVPVSEGGYGTIGLTIQDTKSAVVSVVTTSNSGGLLIAQVAYQINIGHIAPSQQVPQAISSAIYPFYIFNRIYDPGTGKSIVNKPGETISCINIRNNSGSEQFIVLEAYVRTVINGTGSANS